MIRANTYFSSFSQVSGYESPLRQRIKLVKQRCRSYPMDSLDFIMIDLERPETLIRHAEFCTGDLTGRYLDFLSVGMHLEPSDRDRMDMLFERILKCQAPCGAFGRVYVQDLGASEHELKWGAASKLFMGLLRYYMETGSGKALTAAQRNAEYFLSHLDYFKSCCDKHKQDETFEISEWIVEPMALLYGITGDARCLEVCRMVADSLPSTIDRCHSHGFMTTLRGLQFAALYTGDVSWNRLPEKFRQEIAERAVWPDGNIPEVFPMSGRNEGCSIADWVMLNLYAGFITGRDEAYEKAENALYNAMALNQIVNGGFGSRELNSDKRGYAQGELSEECWWCCAHNCGLALVEFIDHAVTLRDGELRINLLVPGRHTLQHDGRTVMVDITTRYPEKADTIVFVNGAPDGMKTRIRIPSGVKNAAIREDALPAGGRRYMLSGKMGYSLEEVPNGVVLRYGPLVLVPLRYCSASATPIDYSKTSIPQGYVPVVMPKGRPAIVPVEQDADGFYLFPKQPPELWKCYEEGILSRLAFENLSVNVPLYFPDGKIRSQRFWPECYSTTTLIGYDLPLVFDKG